MRMTILRPWTAPWLTLLAALAGCQGGADSPAEPGVRPRAPGSAERTEMNPGVPPGWRAREQAQLQTGAWRFFHLSDPSHAESVSEDNLVLRGSEVMRGEQGLRLLLQDHDWFNHPEALPPDVLAHQVGMFIYRGSSRASCEFSVVLDPAGLAPEYPALPAEVTPPSTTLEDGARTLRAWLRRHALQPITLTMTRAGDVTLTLGAMVGRTPAPVATIRPDVPLLESLSRPPNGKPAGYRLWPDGRYEELGPGHEPPDAWVLKLTYTRADLARYLAAASQVDLSGLRPAYEAKARDASPRHVRLQAGGQVRELDITGVRVPELEALEAAMVAARAP